MSNNGGCLASMGCLGLVAFPCFLLFRKEKHSQESRTSRGMPPSKPPDKETKPVYSKNLLHTKSEWMLSVQKILYGIDSAYIEVPSDEFISKLDSFVEENTETLSRSVDIYKNTASPKEYFFAVSEYLRCVDNLIAIENTKAPIKYSLLPSQSKAIFHKYQVSFTNAMLDRFFDAYLTSYSSKYFCKETCIIAYLERVKPYANLLRDENIAHLKKLRDDYLKNTEPSPNRPTTQTKMSQRRVTSARTLHNAPKHTTRKRTYGSVFDSHWLPD